MNNLQLRGTRLGIIGDLHLGKHNTERWDDTYTKLGEWIITTMQSEGIKDIMFLGDVFDGHKEKTNEKAITFKMMSFISNYFTRFAEEFNVIIYSGNHCCYYKDRCDVSGLEMLKGRPNIQIIEETTNFSVGDKNYKIVPWACNIDDGGRVDGLFGHFDIKTFQMNAAKKSESGFTTTQLFTYCDRVYTGHYHNRQLREYSKGTKSIYYVGTPLQLSWSEAGKESVISVVDLETNTMTDEFTNNFSPEFVKVTTSTLIESPEEYKNNILEVIWDVEHNEENTMKVSNILDRGGNFAVRNNFSFKQETVIGELTGLNSAVDPREILSVYISAIEGISDKDRNQLDTLGNHYLQLTGIC